MDFKSDFRKIVKESYESQASLYSKSVTMQLGNLRKLMDYLVNSDIILKQGKLLDVGCGTGIFLNEIQERLGRIEYYGIDLSYEMIKIGKKSGMSSNNLMVGDAEYLCFKKKAFDIVISNSVLHWLNVPEIGHTPKHALGEIFRVLKVNSPLAISVSGYGTAKRFQDSYRKVVKLYKNESNFNIYLFRSDPIGSMHLHELVKMLIDIGYEIKKAELNYEPVIYKCPADYVNDVKAYGYQMYLAAVPESRREEVWAMIRDNFIAMVGNRKYEHDQYIIYIIAMKR